MHTNYNNTTDINAVIRYYLRLLKSNGFIFVLSIITCSLIACLYIYTAPKIYERKAQVMIEESIRPSVTKLDKVDVLNEINFFSSKININDEIEIIRSGKLMSKVVERLNLDIRYTTKNRSKTIELYSPPFELSFCKKPDNDNFSFTVIPIGDKKVKIKDFKKEFVTISDFEQEQEITVGDTVLTPIGRLVFLSENSSIKNYINKEIFVTKNNIENIGIHFAKKLTVSTTKNSNIIKLSIKDYSIARADKILNTLLAVNNEEYNVSKEQIIENATSFINNRIAIIEQELGAEKKSNLAIEHYLTPQENLYLYLLQKREMNEFAKTVTTNFMVIDEATGNNAPISPKR